MNLQSEIMVLVSICNTTKGFSLFFNACIRKENFQVPALACPYVNELSKGMEVKYGLIRKKTKEQHSILL